jgi:hypothetical protein
MVVASTPVGGSVNRSYVLLFSARARIGAGYWVVGFVSIPRLLSEFIGLVLLRMEQTVPVFRSVGLPVGGCRVAGSFAMPP